MGLRINHTGTSEEFQEGAVLVIPGLHELRRYSLRDQTYRPAGAASAEGSARTRPWKGSPSAWT